MSWLVAAAVHVGGGRLADLGAQRAHERAPRGCPPRRPGAPARRRRSGRRRTAAAIASAPRPR
jgi:hypothetical protein